MTNNIKTTYKYFRQLGQGAQRALTSARLASKTFYPSGNVEYNPAIGKKRWIEQASKGLRFTGYADKLINLSYRGWYTNEFQDEVLRGVVYQLPARDGKEQYVYGYADPCNDNCALLVFDIQDIKEKAARLADGFAEIEAEKQREYNEAWQAGLEYASTVKEIKGERKDAMRLIQAIRKERRAGIDPVICEALRNNVRDSLRVITKLKDKRDKLIDNYSSAWRKATFEAFNEGAGSAILA